MYLKDFKSRCGKGGRAGGYLFVGGSGDEYREALDTLRQLVVAPGFESFNISSLSAQDTSVEEAIGSARTNAMGVGGRLVVFRDVRLLKAAASGVLLEYLKSPEPNNCMVVIMSDYDRNHPLVKGAGAAARSDILVVFSPPPWLKRRQLIEERLRGLGLTAEPKALSKLEQVLPDDRSMMSRELEKLRTFLGDSTRVRPKDVDELLVDTSSGNVFELADAVGAQDTATALRVADRLLDQGEEPLKLLGFLARQYRLLFMARQSGERGGGAFRDLSELGRRSPKALEELTARASAHREEDLVRQFLHLREADRLIKSTGLDPALVLEAFLCGVLRGSTGPGETDDAGAIEP